MAKYDIHIMESLLGVLGNRGNDIYSKGTRVKFLVEQDTKAIRGTKGRLSPSEGLISDPIFKPSTSLFDCSSVCQHVILIVSLKH